MTTKDAKQERAFTKIGYYMEGSLWEEFERMGFRITALTVKGVPGWLDLFAKYEDHEQGFVVFVNSTGFLSGLNKLIRKVAEGNHKRDRYWEG